jgi:hypothetical protein
MQVHTQLRFARWRAGAARALRAAVALSPLVAGSLPAQARDPHAAQPERPTVATHAGTVAPGWFEIEAGVQWDRHADKSRAQMNTLVSKIGLASHLQLTLFANTASNDAGSGFGDVAAGVKWRVLDQHPVLGDFAILPILKAPTGSEAKGTGTGTTDASLWLVSSHDWGPFHLDANLAYTRRDGSASRGPLNQWLWMTAGGWGLTDKLDWTAEVFGAPGTGGIGGERPIASLLTGPMYTVRDWVVVDAGIITPLIGDQPRSVYAGVTWNIGRLWTAEAGAAKARTLPGRSYPR